MLNQPDVSKPKVAPNKFSKFFLNKFTKTQWGDSQNAQDQALSASHREVHLSNKCLAFWFERVFESHIANFVGNDAVELGSGGSQFKSFYPKLKTSDVLDLPFVDMVVDAQKMPFEDSSVGNLTLINVLHHIPRPLEFFQEANRVLKKGGRIVCTEPYIGPFSYFIYKFVHHEPCHYKVRNLNLSDGAGGLLESNQALPTLLFGKNWIDVKTVAPNLTIKSIKYHSFFSYFITGGVNYKRVVPVWFYESLFWIDRGICFLFGRALACFFTVVIEKNHDL